MKPDRGQPVRASGQVPWPGNEGMQQASLLLGAGGIKKFPSSYSSQRPFFPLFYVSFLLSVHSSAFSVDFLLYLSSG
ncbi:hypothetical protein C0Q70_09560 [Pomacea canaliculata]|uniref:Uncharacterized protein n=1 Tax=Pomacea canaliculata TaxID=400727 RepID=A0A2T7PA64_POMCA|nr:hypothetical protein C0Q70_09560 [Pomacea canaliculata]